MVYFQYTRYKKRSRYVHIEVLKKRSKCFVIRYFVLYQAKTSYKVIGAVLLILVFFGAITVGLIVINDTVNNRLTPQRYPETQFLGVSAFSYEYGLVFTTILGVFVLFGGLFIDSKKKK